MEMHPILSSLVRSKTGAILVAAQVALTLAIVCNALFVVNQRLATAHRPTGVDEPAVFQILYTGIGEIDDREAMQQHDIETLRAIPGVKAVAAVNSFPISQSGWRTTVAVKPVPSAEVSAAHYFSGESFIDAMGLRLVEGRDFEEGEVRVIDDREAELETDTVILTRHLARRMFPDDASALGKTIYMGTGPTAKPMRIVGVVAELMSSHGETAESAHDAFISPVKYLDNSAHYAVRTEPADRGRVMQEAEKALSALRDDRVLVQVRSMDEIRQRRYRHERGGASMLIVLTICLLLVTASGIVGVASLWVSQRRKQIGVRRALGARRRDILRYFVAENLIITTLGIVFGVGLAIGLNVYLVSHVEMAKLPVAYLAGGIVAVWGLGVVAVLGPAWRASSVSPATATRSA